MSKNVSRLLAPRSLAVIGGEEARRVVEQSVQFGFEGNIWPVHPTRQTMQGLPCYRSLSELPAAPDIAYVAVNRERTIELMRELSAMGAGGAICYAAGFAEAQDGNVLQRALLEAAGAMPVVGPNCYGFINAIEGAALWPDQHGLTRCPCGVAIVAQSSNIAINLTMQKRGLPIAMMLTAGNQAQLGLSDLANAALEDDRITAIGLHIEGLDDVSAFERLAQRARMLKKPIVVIKVGKSDQAQNAAMTHTASLSGSDVAHDALFRRLGIARAHTLEIFLETLKLVHVHGTLPGADLLSMSCSGGEAALMADAAEGRSVTYRPYASDEAGDLGAILGPIVTVSNPLDYNTFIWGDWPAMTRMFEAALAPQFDLAMLVMDFPRADRCADADWRGATDSFVAAVKQMSARAAVVASLPETMPESLAEDLIAKGIAPLCGLDAAVAAAEAAAFIGSAWASPPPLSLLSARSMNGETTVLETTDEHQGKQALKQSGLVVPQGIALDADASVDVGNLRPPYALKALGIAHKTEARAVRLNLGVDEIEAARASMQHLSDRFLLEEMARKPDAELIVGVTRDPVVGLVMTIGAGGVLAELLEDTATLLLPVVEADIRAALNSLRLNRVLEGWRGGEATDIDALVANIICIANFACANADTLEELDVNPLFATQFGSVAVDALIVRRKLQ